MYLKDLTNIDSERVYTSEGYLVVPARIARIGIQEYRAFELGLTDRDPMDIIKVYRPPEEVFKPESLSSFANKPVTDDHPPELVNSSNYKQYNVGFSSAEVKVDGMFVSTTLYIADKQAIKNIEEGKSQLSNGYESDIEFIEGVDPDGESYHAVQRNINGNHIAIVQRGRAGSACKVADNLPNGESIVMAKITIDGVDFEVSEQAAQAVGKLQSKLADTEAEAEAKDEELKAKEDEMEEKANEAKATADSLQAKLDDAKSKIPTADALDTLVADRSKLVAQATSVLPDLKWQGKDSAAIMREVVTTKCTNVQMDSASDDYVKARFDMLVESVSTDPNKGLIDSLVDPEQKPKVTDNRTESQIARDKMMSDSRDAWKKKG